MSNVKEIYRLILEEIRETDKILKSDGLDEVRNIESKTPKQYMKMQKILNSRVPYEHKQNVLYRVRGFLWDIYDSP